MKTPFLLLAMTLLFFSCTKKNQPDTKPAQQAESTKVLMLKVDYQTNTFLGGKELNLSGSSNSFTITNEYDPPQDFGYLKLKYQELDQQIFDGGIVWMGNGTINYPQNIQAANQFASVTTNDIVYPTNGLEDVFNPYNEPRDPAPAWLAIQHKVKVREYLAANPTATVKVFLYASSRGPGNPAEWQWIFFLKN